jgi:V/A-type H+-transporting ATPase subunit C
VEPENATYYFIRGGKELDFDKLVIVSQARTTEGVIKLLSNTSYGFLTEIPNEYVTTEKISAFEKALDKFLLQKALAMFSGDPLSFAMVVGYLWAKLNEITNIRIIATCKTEYCPEKELMEELVFV